MTGSLRERLRIEEGSRVALVNEPDGFASRLGELPGGARLFERASEPLDVIVFFAESRRHLARRLSALVAFLAPDGLFEVAYPRDPRSGELTLEVVTELARDVGLEPVGDPVGLEDGHDDRWDVLPFAMTRPPAGTGQL